MLREPPVERDMLSLSTACSRVGMLCDEQASCLCTPGLGSPPRILGWNAWIPALLCFPGLSSVLDSLAPSSLGVPPHHSGPSHSCILLKATFPPSAKWKTSLLVRGPDVPEASQPLISLTCAPGAPLGGQQRRFCETSSTLWGYRQSTPGPSL